jgi:ABC-type transport system involved in multi-copper enzyme maturation permease subunit
MYVSVFFTLGMLFSSRSRRAATALMLAMFFWVVLVLVWPNASAFAVSKLMPLESDADLSLEGFLALAAKEGWQKAASHHRLVDLWMNQYQQEVSDFRRKRNVDTSFGGMMTRDPTGETLIGKFQGPPEKLPLYQEFMKFKEELRIDYADKAGRIWREYLTKNPIRQAKLARNIARISPAIAYTSATEILAATDLDSHLRFLQQAGEYRNELIQYLHDQNAFGSEAWYDREAGKKINTEGIPIFRELPEPLVSSIKRATFDIMILILLNVAFFLLTYLSFLKYDVK